MAKSEMLFKGLAKQSTISKMGKGGNGKMNGSTKFGSVTGNQQAKTNTIKPFTSNFGKNGQKKGNSTKSGPGASIRAAILNGAMKAKGWS